MTLLYWQAPVMGNKRCGIYALIMDLKGHYVYFSQKSVTHFSWKESNCEVDAGRQAFGVV